MSDITIEFAARWLPSGLDELRREADDDGIRIVSTVIDRWIDGTQRYDRPGESLLVARVAAEDRIVAVAGWRGARAFRTPCGCAASTCRRALDVRASHEASPDG